MSQDKKPEGKEHKEDNPLTKELKKCKEFASAFVFDDEGKILATTCKPEPEELKALLSSYDDRDATVGKGLTVFKKHYEVQRFHDDLIYGRLSTSREKEGICLCRVQRAKSQKPVYALITYVLPVLSARAVPILREFASKHLATL